MNLINPFIIVSSQLASVSDKDNQARHVYALTMLEYKGIPYMIVNGTYEGIKEPSIMISASHEGFAQELASMFNQECYLLVDANRLMTLNKPTGEVIKRIGQWSQVNSIEGLTAYTEHNGIYYAAA